MNHEDIRKTTVIGAGAMGHGIAQVISMAGVKVFLNDIKQEYLDSAVSNIRDSLNFLVGKGKISQEEMDDILQNRLETSLDLQAAVSDAQLVVEAVPENMNLKKSIFRDISEQAPQEAILGSNTSTMSITELSREVKNPERMLGMHFFNPVNRMKLVEVIACESTREEYMDTICEFSKKCNKIPVKVLKDSPGFIVNRINAPNQALVNAVLEEGKIPPSAIDTSLKGVGMPMGAFELSDYVGLDVFYDTLQYYSETLSNDYKPGSYVQQRIENRELGMKSGKGIYEWKDGKPEYETKEASPEITPTEFLALQINEAVKVYKEGLAKSREDIDQAMVYGTKAIAGPFALGANLGAEQITNALEKIRDRYGLSISEPEPEVRDGSFKEFT
ncbi:MAG: 3-hydroxyacyl-CoA dehydrogenase NAD-binding domain-containing protein [Thermodesulfobacteriota bacterium]